jgi:5-amino-6-(5-phosphoribosylamino)uracil reductase
MQAYRFAFDAVGSGSGTLMADDFYSRLPDRVAARRTAAGREPQPLALVVAGARPLPTDRRWFGYEDQRRVMAVGSSSPHAADQPLPGMETWVAPTEEPEPAWLLQRLAADGVRSLLLEGGPTLNSAFLSAGLLDELYWTIGPRVLANDALPMIAPVEIPPVEARLVSAHRHGSELFLRYRLASG